MWKKPKWQWEEGDEWGTELWVDYDEENTEMLEEAHKAEINPVDLDRGYFQKRPGYFVDFEGGFQASKMTGMTRRIRRLDELQRSARPELVQALHTCFTSTNVVALVSKDDVTVDEQEAKLSEDALIQLFDKHVPNLHDLRDWTGKDPVTKFFFGTYTSGVPKFKANNPSLNNVLVQAFRYIVHEAEKGNEAAIRCMRPLAEAFESCQAEQAREINSLFGTVTGRDKGLPEQLAKFIDEYKQRVLNTVIPDVFETTEDNSFPHKQVPHIYNRCLVDLGDILGLSGVEIAQADAAKPPELDETAKTTVVDRFRELFDMEQLLEDITSDINQSGNVERAIDRTLLLKHEFPASFERHKLMYDEDEPQVYNFKKPTEEEEFNAFVFPGIVAEMLACIFLPPAE
ncbi:hypothetical protein PTSG_09956 [Salpingoeca rosetta]|uniref:WWE domain-containing protein n=1 Tax=Salpingoeca rosetta (strain ATCC 50818 / BSB-021) TaxID=946362 RepID=F2UNN0_SALR5|nr:uncharacterized protein PTSG_09956 [Salpingoeca rosetta]EGD79235.1 hypothetical protein PTSG_09956 [Salpingoeca rosetta]|eukprot:XP_004989320.1 hypothetical protein PTSG_09956 [Salpingoeca rosetta]